MSLRDDAAGEIQQVMSGDKRRTIRIDGIELIENRAMRHLSIAEEIQSLKDVPKPQGSRVKKVGVSE